VTSKKNDLELQTIRMSMNVDELREEKERKIISCLNQQNKLHPGS
jgi:hypothetical protein